MERLVGVPRGKMEEGESAEDALCREIREELAVEISVRRFFMTVEYDYPKFHLVLHCFLCEVKSGILQLLEHEAAKWLKKEELESVKWLPADIEVIKRIEEEF